MGNDKLTMRYLLFSLALLSHFTLAAQCSTEVTVMNSLDSGPGSLRQALLDVCDDGSIEFSPATDESPFYLNSELVIDKNVSIVGNGINNTILSGQSGSRIFKVEAELEVTIESLMLKDAFATNNGGAIFNEGEVYMTDLLFSNNFENGSPKAFSGISGALYSIDPPALVTIK